MCLNFHYKTGHDLEWTILRSMLENVSTSADIPAVLWSYLLFSLSCIGEGNGNPLQCSCLENPRDGGTWWAAVSGVAQSRTRLKQLSSSSSSRVFYVLQRPFYISFAIWDNIMSVFASENNRYDQRTAGMSAEVETFSSILLNIVHSRSWPVL